MNSGIIGEISTDCWILYNPKGTLRTFEALNMALKSIKHNSVIFSC